MLLLRSFLHPVFPLAAASDGWLYRDLLDWLHPFGQKVPLIYPVTAYLLLFIQASTLNAFANERRLYSQSHLLVAFSYLLFATLLSVWTSFSSTLLVNTILVWYWTRLNGIYHKDRIKGDLFNLSFIISICSFLYFPSILFILVLFIALLVYRPFRIAEWIVVIIGMIIPYYFLFVYLYVFGQWGGVQFYFPVVQFHLPALPSGIKAWMDLLMVLIPVASGILYHRDPVRRMLVHNRKTWGLTGFLLVITLLMVFSVSARAGDSVVFLLMPISFYAAMYYTATKSKLFPELTVWGAFFWILIRAFIPG